MEKRDLIVLTILFAAALWTAAGSPLALAAEEVIHVTATPSQQATTLANATCASADNVALPSDKLEAAECPPKFRAIAASDIEIVIGEPPPEQD